MNVNIPQYNPVLKFLKKLYYSSGCLKVVTDYLQIYLFTD